MSARWFLMVLGVLGLVPGAALAEQVVRCESPEFRYQQCRVDTRGGVRLTRQISNAPCIRGQTWGEDRNGIWVDQGCAAEFRVGDHDSGGNSSSGDRRVVCESKNFQYNTCRLDTRGRVRLTRQISNAPCREGDTWGVSRDGIWVDEGCAAEFRVEAGSGGGRPPWAGGGRPPWAGDDDTDPRRLTCESRDNRYRVCRADTRGGVRLGRQSSNAPCRRGDTWGVNRQGVWVDRGCAGEFILGQGADNDHGDGYPGEVPDNRRIVCRSHSLRRNFCRANVNNGVRLTEQLSRRPCIQGDTWGVERGGIWVTEGCSAIFTLGRGRALLR